MKRTKIVPALALVLGIAAVVAVAALQHRSAASHDARVRLAQAESAVNTLQTLPLANTGGALTRDRIDGEIRATKAQLNHTLAALMTDAPPARLRVAHTRLRANYAAADRVWRVVRTYRKSPTAAQLAALLPDIIRFQESGTALKADLAAASGAYGSRASRSGTQATVGSAAAILLLLVAFAVLYGRSVRARAVAERLSEENEKLLDASRRDATTDALTGLPNRRALADDLARELGHLRPGTELVLGMFDLDGLKQYNDTFGHPAGDALLARLGERLLDAVAGRATVYRMGGDEFCLLAAASEAFGAEILRLAASALHESGEAFEIACSYGFARLPAEAGTPEEALRLADQRLYDDKSSRASASRQTTDVLLRVLDERSPDVRDHLVRVADLARRTALQLGLPDHDVRLVALAAQLHDVGKAAIPDAILTKTGPLTEREQEFMRRHPLIAERIMHAAPSLAPAVPLVRASHERVDGSGYPDGLRGAEIPLGARIIAACSALDALARHADGPGPDEALSALRGDAEARFDARVVDALARALAERDAPVITSV